MKNIKISVVVIAKNEELMLKDCLSSVEWADEIILVDTGSTDKTRLIAKEYGANIIEHANGSFSDWRNAGLKEAKGEWIFYVDADERVSATLKQEILQRITEKDGPTAYAIPRKNIILNKEMKHGGQWPDYQMRFFKKETLKGYKNELHEVAEFIGKQGYLKAPLIHLKHNNISDMVEKTNKWSLIEARLLFDSHHPQMSWWRFLRIMITELWYRLIVLRGFLDGPEGVIYAFYLTWSKFLTYAKLWELQLK